MKMLNCLVCNDVVALMRGNERSCLCGQSKGRYTTQVKAVYSGPARILGFRNEQYDHAVPNQDYVWFVIPEGRNIRKERGSSQRLSEQA